MTCRKFLIVLCCVVIIGLQKRLALESSDIIILLGFAGTYVGVQGAADVTANVMQKKEEKSTPPAS